MQLSTTPLMNDCPQWRRDSA